jgi:hypothetical protein
MGDFLNMHCYFITVHKQLANGVTIIIVCNDEFIYQYSKLINVISKFKIRGFPNHLKMARKFGGFL